MDYDIVIIGAGASGYKLALSLASKASNKKVALIEKSNLGGVCLNEGCIPTKNYLQSASYYKDIQKAQQLGIAINSQKSEFCLQTLQKNTQELINQSIQTIQAKCKSLGVDVFKANAKLLNKNEIELTCTNNQTKTIKADIIVLSAGSSTREINAFSIDHNKLITSSDVFKLQCLPKSMLIVGGGVIGVEFASFFSTFGTEVTICEGASNILPFEDSDVSKTLARELGKKGINIYTNANASYVSQTKDEVMFDIAYKKGADQKNIRQAYDVALIAIGRVPNTKNLGLENADVEVDERGFVVVNNNLQTSTKNIFAIGDIISSASLAHQAEYEAKSVAEYILHQKALPQNALCVNVAFCSPQVASVGAKEYELKEQNINYLIKKIFFKTNAKAKIKGDDGGFVKILYSQDTSEILGASIIGLDACEMIHVFLVAINKKTKLDEIREYIFAHPTLCECINSF